MDWIDPPFCSGYWGPKLEKIAAGEEFFERQGEANLLNELRSMFVTSVFAFLQPSALFNGQSWAAFSPRRYRESNSFDRWARILRTSRRLPLTLGITSES